MTDAPGGSEPNLVGWWSGDGTTRDLARGNGMTLDGASYVLGKVRQAFSSRTERLHRKFLPLPTFTLPRITVALWTRRRNITEPSVIVPTTKDHDGWQLQIELTGWVGFVIGVRGDPDLL